MAIGNLLVENGQEEYMKYEGHRPLGESRAKMFMHIFFYGYVTSNRSEGMFRA